MVQYIRGNPAIDQFHARVAADEAMRLREEESFRQRLAAEQLMGGDAGLRAFMGNVYGEEPAAPPTPAPAPAAPVPNMGQQAGAEVMPLAQQPALNGVPLDAGQETAPPASAAPPTWVQTPVAAPPSNVTQPVAPPSVMAAATPAATQAPTSSAAPTPGLSRQDRFAAGMREMVKRPGTGRTALSLYQTDQTNERARGQEGVRLFIEASRVNDISMMRAVAQQYGMGIPPEVLNNREVMAEFAVGLNLASTAKIDDDDKALAFAKGYLQAGGQKAGRSAVMAGISEAQKVQPAFSAAYFDKTPEGEVFGVDKQMNVRSTGKIARVPGTTTGGAGGAAGGVSKQTQYMNDRIKVLVAAGMPLADAQKLVAGGAGVRPMTQQQRISLASRLMSTLDANYKPVFGTLEEALAAVDRAASGGGAPGAAGTPVGGGVQFNTGLPAAGAGAATPDVPPGAKYVGRQKGTGKAVYEDANGDQYVEQ